MRAQLARTGHRAQVEADIEREGLVSFFELLPHRIAFQRDVHLVGKRRFRHDALHDLHLAVSVVEVDLPAVLCISLWRARIVLAIVQHLEGCQLYIWDSPAGGVDGCFVHRVGIV